MRTLVLLTVITLSWWIDNASADCYDVCIPNFGPGYKEYTCSDLSPPLPIQRDSKGTCRSGQYNGKQTVCCHDMLSYAQYLIKVDKDKVAKIAVGAQPGEFPHQVYLTVSRPGIGSFSCGGTIYNKNYIITANHCVRNYTTKVHDKPEWFTVTAGVNNILFPPPENQFKVEDIIHHEKNQEYTDGYDIAIMRLKDSLPANNPRIKPLKIAPQDFKIDYNRRGIFMGWGNRNYTRVTATPDVKPTPELQSTPDLHKSFIPLRSPVQCQELSARDLEYYEPLERDLCIAGGNSGARIGQGDSGGPTVCPDTSNGNRPVLCGVASYKSACVECSVPDVYVRVSHFNEWIRNNTKHEPQESEGFKFLDVNMDGESGEPEEYLVRILGKNRNCDGVLIAPNLILTTQFCMTEIGARYVIIHTKTKQELLLESFVPNNAFKQTKSDISRRLFNDELRQNDLHMIKIKNPIKIAFYPKIPVSNYMPKGGMELSYISSRDQRELRNYNVIDQETCRKSYGILNVTVTDDQLCGVQVYSGGSTCDRPLGSPLICEQKYLCGLASSRGCFYNFPNVFASTSDSKIGYFIRNALRSFQIKIIEDTDRSLKL